MKRLIPAFAVLLGCASTTWAAAPGPLATLEAVHALTNAEASKQLPVAFQATVTYYRSSDTDLFVQDGDTAIYVNFRPGAKLDAGDRVLVTGRTQESFRPIVDAENVRLLHHGIPPAPVAASFEQLVRTQLDCRRVSLRAQIRSADMLGSGDLREIYLHLLTDGGYVDAAVNSTDQGALKRLLDAEVEITGIATAVFDQRNQLTGARIDVESLADIRVLKAAAIEIDSLPITPFEDVLGSYRVTDLSHRVRVQGTVTYYQPGSTAVLQRGPESLWILTMDDEPLRIGDLADVTGYPEVHNGHLSLSHAEIRDTHVQAPIRPLRVGWRELGFGGNAFNLVTTEGRVVRQVREAAVDEYVLEADGHVFSAIFRHPPTSDWAHAPAMRMIPPGSKVRVTGIGMFYTPDPFNGPVASDILLRSSDDVVVVSGPTWLSTRNLIILISLLLGAVFAMSLKGWSLERKLRRQTALMAARNEAEAALERQRSHILEEINAARPLAEILGLIAKMISSQLNGAPCWCEITDGALLGECPSQTSGLRIIQTEISGRDGCRLGVLHTALDPLPVPSPGEAETLAGGARLASLAIETQRLYSDLHHRSEFDLLTEAHNRFSLDRYLDACIAEADQTAGIFGLIYVDLNQFKQVNDQYGHQTGDLYLQEVALRMRRQLRPVDMLARLGGDEFAVLVPAIHHRAVAAEIAQRLDRCFDELFSVDGNLLRGSASVGIALYPEDGATRDSLLNAADAAMYRAKSGRPQIVDAGRPSQV